MSGYVARLDAAGLVTRVRSEQDRRRVGLELTDEAERVLRSARSRRTAWLAARLTRLDNDELAAIEAALRPSRKLLVRPRDAGVPARQPPHVREPPQVPQLPALLLRPGRLDQRHLDAEHRDRLARPRADPLAGRRRHPRALPVPAVQCVRALLGRDRRPARRAQARDRDAGRVCSSSRPCSPPSRSAASSTWQVYVLAALRGAVLVFDAPARQALTYQMVGRDELPNAVALNSSLFNAARVVGPAAGGVVVAAAGVGFCFAVNAASFLAVLGGLLRCASELFRSTAASGAGVLRRNAGGAPLRRPRPTAARRARARLRREHVRVQLQRPAAGAREAHARRRPGGVRDPHRVLRRRRAGRRAALGVARPRQLARAARSGRPASGSPSCCSRPSARSPRPARCSSPRASASRSGRRTPTRPCSSARRTGSAAA